MDNNWDKGSGSNGSQGNYGQGGYNQGGYNQGGYNQGSYNQGGFNQPGMYPNDDKASIILILGILSIICCAPCGIGAIVMRNMYKDTISPQNQGLVSGGFITGIIGLALWAVALVFYLILFMIAVLGA